MTAPTRATLLALAEEVAREAGRLIVDERPAGPRGRRDQVQPDRHRHRDGPAVRAADRRPDHGGPPGRRLPRRGGRRPRRARSGVSWVVDPIDGTVNYLYEIPAYAVSVAARVGDEVVAGAVVNPVSGEVWTALRGEGAWLDGRPARSWREPPALAMALVATGFGYDAAPPGPAGRGPAGRAAAGPRHPAGRARRRSTSARWRPAGSTATTSRASSRGTSRPAAWSPGRPGPW